MIPYKRTCHPPNINNIDKNVKRIQCLKVTYPLQPDSWDPNLLQSSHMSRCKVIGDELPTHQDQMRGKVVSLTLNDPMVLTPARS